MVKKPRRPGILSRPQPVVMPPQDEVDPDQAAFDAQAAKITPEQWGKVMEGLKALMDRTTKS